MKAPQIGKDQLENNLFTAQDEQRLEGSFQRFDETAKEYEAINIAMLAMDFPASNSIKERKKIETEWLERLPTLNNVKELSVRHRVNQTFFEAICRMKNLETLTFWTSKVADLKSLTKLKNLEFLHLGSFSQLQDISPIVEMKSLKRLSIDNCFKVTNYELIGKMTWLKALSLEGDTFAPKNLILPSLKPFSSLANLRHLQLSTTSIKDKSFLEILNLKNLVRLDAGWRMKNDIRQKILAEHRSLKSGFFTAYDFAKNDFREGVEWWVEV